MHRDLLNDLLTWKQSPRRKPLLLRGARQVGKSWIIRKLSESFDNFVEINFEKHIQPRAFFEGDLEVKIILEKLALYSGQSIVPGKTLLFLDEIQACEPAIIALRYFKEEIPELHVIAAGSLVDFAIDNIGIPVGRIQFMFLYPLSFCEYLTVIGKNTLREHINRGAIDPVFHQTLLEHFKTYTMIGGMPEVIKTWLDTTDFKACHDVQDEIILSYKQDFSKYAHSHQIDKLDVVFANTPQQFGHKFVYKNVESEFRSNVLKEALLLLKKAGILHIAYHSSAQGLPLQATIDEKRFKVFFFDIGIANRLMGLDEKTWLLKPLEVAYKGGIFEQFVAQEYIALSSKTTPAQIYYWHREAKYSNAEVDLLFVKNGEIVPVEVKSSSKGTLKSMRIFLESHPHSKYGIKVSEQPNGKNGDILEIPFYGLEAWLNS